MADPGDIVQPEVTDEVIPEKREEHESYAEILAHLAHIIRGRREKKHKKEEKSEEKDEKKPAEKPAVEPEKVDPITQRNNFFLSYENNFRSKLHTAIGTDRKDLHPHVQNFAKDYIQSRRDALFAQSNPEASINELLKRFPQLSSLIKGAQIAKIQDDQAKESAKKYEESLKAFKTQEEFRKVQIAERVSVLSSEYAKQLQTTGVTGGEYSRTISAFEKAATETLSQPIRETTTPEVAPTNHLMADIQKKMVPLYGEGYIDHGGAYNKTLGWYAQQKTLQQHMIEEQKLSRDDLLQHVQLLQKVQIQQPTITIRPIPQYAHYQVRATPTPAKKGVGGRIISGIDSVIGRILGSGARNSARKTAQAAVSTAAKSAALGLSSTAWIVIGIIILIVLILVLVVVVNQTSTTSQPYPIVSQNIPTSIPSTSPSISTSPVPLPSGAIASGYGQPGQTWDTISPPYTAQTQFPIKGFVSWFESQSTVDDVIRNRGTSLTPCPECLGNIAVVRAGDLNRRVWIQRQDGTIEGPYRVFDVAGKNDVVTILNYSKNGRPYWAADLDLKTAINWGLTDATGKPHFKGETVIIYDRKPN